ncbi:MAG: aldo/keto reductase [Eggerthellales bacterium]|nr:aldo/keto reductase [Eggerthellales bacterium]
MIYTDFQDEKLSLFGMGCMRLPLIDGVDSNIDKAAATAMIDYAMEQGVNYYDVAWGYHGGNSELVVGEALSRYSRESFKLATKFPGYDLGNMGKVAEIFEEQLRKCQVEYFDFYLIHNVCEMNIDAYLDDAKYGTLSYLIEQKRAGRIRHLGFSAHGNVDTIRRFLEAYGEHMEFCQLQVNPLDWTLQHAQEKYDYLTQAGLPVWVMEPLRGGMMCNFEGENRQKLQQLRPEETNAGMAFRWLQRLDNLGVILSGMSTMDMLTQNIATFQEHKPLTDEEANILEEVANSLVDSIPCTRCRYCVPKCPLELDIPNLLALLNDGRAVMRYTTRMGIDALPEEKRPGACIGCGSCMAMCPQNIQIPDLLAELQAKADKLMPWPELRKYD